MRRFSNPHLANSKRNIWEALKWKFGFYQDETFIQKPPFDFVYPAIPEPFNHHFPHALWIGHSTYLIEVGGLTLLTDPVWDEYCSPIPIAPLKRLTPPPLSLRDLPPIDLVLISHNHYDHLDAKTVAFLKRHHPKIEWIVPVGLSPWFQKRRIVKVRELNWWQSHCFSRFCITATPTQHFSGRTLWDQNKTLWNGYVLESGDKKIYFTGDTGYNSHDFKEIGERWRGFDLSLIPIGAYIPREFMKTVHIDPKEAVQIHQDVRSRFSLGMHWKTFRLSDEHIDSPPYDLYLAMKEKQLPFSAFLPVNPGIYVNF